MFVEKEVANERPIDTQCILSEEKSKYKNSLLYSVVHLEEGKSRQLIYPFIDWMHKVEFI